MSPAVIKRDDLDELRQRNESARLQLETLQIESELTAAQAIAELPKLALREGWGDLVDPREFLYDTPGFGGYQMGGGSAVPMTTLSDREDGRNRPFFETEQELAIIRGTGRVLTTLFPAGICIVENLRNYTVAGGFEAKAQAADSADPPAGLVQALQRVIDTFANENNWGKRQGEAHDRSRAEGEVFLLLEPKEWRTRLRILEPDQVRDPQSFGRDLETWLGIDGEFPSSWSFGVHTRQNDCALPLGYHVTWNSTGTDFDYVPASRMEHIKRNVPDNVKRGVSDFYPVTGWLNRAEKLLRNTADGSSVQAAIAFIRQHATGTTGSQASGLRSANAYDTRTQNLPGGGSRTRYIQRYEPGTILDINAGLEYKAGPMGSERAPNFINVVQAGLRYIGTRWCMPEYMISGDASNANYSSTLVAESPFVKAREADQREFKTPYASVLWKVVRIAWEGGYFDRFNVSYQQIEQLIDLTLTPPTVATRDPLARAQTAEIEISSGTLSKRTAATEAGRDYDAELENMAKEPKAEPPAGMPNMPIPGMPALESLIERLIDKDKKDKPCDTVQESLKSLLSRIEALLECGGKGGKPGPCPSRIKQRPKIGRKKGQRTAPPARMKEGEEEPTPESADDRLRRAAGILWEGYP